MATTHKSARQRIAADNRLKYQRRILDACSALLDSSKEDRIYDIGAVAKLFKVEEKDLRDMWVKL